MGKKTDHKKLWRKAKKENVLLANEVGRLNDIIEGQADTLCKIRDGKINIKKALAVEKVAPSAELQKVIDQARERTNNEKK